MQMFSGWKRVKLNLYNSNLTSQSTLKTFDQSKMVTGLPIWESSLISPWPAVTWKKIYWKPFVNYSNRIDVLPIYPLCKIDICQKHVYSQIKWDLSIYYLSETWVKENIDSHLNWLYRKWLQLPISANITHLQMPQSKLGLNITSAKKLHNKCKLSVRRILNTSPNLEAGNFTKSQALNMLIQTQS